MATVLFWTVARESFIAPTSCGVEAIKLSGQVIKNKLNIPHNIGIISNQNMIQGKSNQVLPLYESSINNHSLKQNKII